MKKITFVVIIFLFMTFQSYGQQLQGSNIWISLGYGFPNWSSVAVSPGLSGNYDYGISVNTSFGPVHGKLEFRPNDMLSILISANYNYVSLYGYGGVGNNPNVAPYSIENRGSLSVLCRLNFNFINTEKEDAYFGAGMGGKFYKYYYYTNDPQLFSPYYNNNSGAGFELTAGYRHFYSANFGIYVEGGIAQSLVQVGFIFKVIPRKLDAK
jgi:hypothetical protein